MSLNSNTRIIEAEFDYIKPTSLNEALDILSSKEKVKIYAGGTDLIVKLKEGVPIEMKYMMDINGIGEINEYVIDPNKGARIGTGVRLSALEHDPRIKEHWPGLYEAITSMAGVSVRNMASIGGNVCNASPGADTAGPLICYEATIELASKRGTRTMPVEDFFKGGSQTALRQDEMLVFINLPMPKANTGAAFIKMSRIKADLAKLSITVVIRREENKVVSIRISMASLASTPLFLREVCATVNGREMSRELIVEIVDGMANTIKPRDGGNRTTGAYRRDVAPIITRDAVIRAWKASGGELL